MALDIVDQDFYTYEDVESEYLEERRLSKGANSALLWGLGVGATIFGHFFGWNFGVWEAGFWGMVIATLLVAVMYLCLVFSVAELSAALPGAGGFYSFARHAFGPFGGLICGTMTLIQYLVMPAVMVVFIGSYLNQLIPSVPVFVWWVLSYAIFVSINIASVRWTLRVSSALTLLAILILIVFYVSAVVTGSVNEPLLANINSFSFQSTILLPKGWSGVFAALPFAVWFYLAVEQLPVAAEETPDVAKNMPRALIGTFFTLLLLSLLTLFIGSNIDNGVLTVGRSLAPLPDGFNSIFGIEIIAILIGLIALMASFHAMIYAYGRVLFALSRAGYLPRWLSTTSARNRPIFRRAKSVSQSANGTTSDGTADGSASDGTANGTTSDGTADGTASDLSSDGTASDVSSDGTASDVTADDTASDVSSDGTASDPTSDGSASDASHDQQAGKLAALQGRLVKSLNIEYQTPARALIFGAVVGLICAFFINNSDDSIVGQVLLNMGVFSAVFSYMMVFGSYIVLKRERPNLPRPYKSPLGHRGAIVGLIGAIIVLLACLSNLAYQPGVYGVVMILIASMLYFVFYSRKRLVAQAPAEERALKSDLPIKKLTITRQTIRKAVTYSAVLIGIYGLVWYLLKPPTLSCMPNCMGTNLAGRYLAGADFSQINLVEANLRGANLSGVNLRNADLSGAVLFEANLENADLSGAKLLGVDLSEANLTGVTASDTDMRGANLREANLTKVDLTEVKLRGVILSEAILVSANLSGVNLSGVRLTSANLNGANLTEANLSGVSLSTANLSGAQLNEANLEGAWLNISTLIGADMQGANLNGASLIGAQLASANLSEAQLVGTLLVGADFNGANLRSTNLSGAQLRKGQLRQNALQADPILMGLNRAQLEEALQDINLSGVHSNSKTIFPDEQASDIQALVAEGTEKNNSTEEAGTIKVGLLYSLSGALAISEAPLYNATLLAINEINVGGGISGQQIVPIVEDGASDWQFFAEKALKLLVEDEVAVVFGGSTSASRKVLLPIFEELNGFLFYPAQYEGQEQSPNIFYTGAEPSQQIIPAVKYLLSQGHQDLFLVGSDYVFPRIANTVIKAQLANRGDQEDQLGRVLGEEYFPLGQNDFSALISEIQASQPDVIFNTLSGESNIAFFQQLSKAGITAKEIPVMSVSIGEEEVRLIGPENIVGHLTASSYYQTIDTPENQAFVANYKKAYGPERVTSDPIHTAYSGVYLWRELVDEANSTDVDTIKKVILKANQEEEEETLIQITAPGGVVRLDPATQHTYKIARIGMIGENGLIEEVFSSEEPIKPDPFLSDYEWATEFFSKE
ncbi:MAG: amino acid permease [Ardenticatenaceae bacterium]